MKKLIILISLIFSVCNVSNAQVLFPNHGGTGLGALPSYGQVLVGNSSGLYTLTATSSLGTMTSVTASSPLTGGVITTTGSIGCQSASGAQNGCLTSSDWATFNNKSDWATTSNTYWESTKSRWATTSSDYWGGTKGYLTSLAGAASSTLLSDVNYWSGKQTFTNSSTTLQSSSYASSTLGYFGSLTAGSITGSSLNLGSGLANMLAGFDASGNLTSTSSPQVAFINATSTTANSTFFGGLIAGLTIGKDFSVGTSTPYSKLSVWGEGTGTNRLFELTNNASTTILAVKENGTSYFLGNLGIGTTSPYSMLSVAGQVVAQNYVATSSAATSTFAGGITGPANFTVQQNSGWVGIGTLTPRTNLEVATRMTVGAGIDYGSLAVNSVTSLINVNNTFTNASKSVYAIYSIPTSKASTGNTALANAAVVGDLWISNSNSSNYTNAVGAFGVGGRVETRSGGTGLITGTASFFADMEIDGASTTNAYGLYVKTPIVNAASRIGTYYGSYLQGVGTLASTSYGFYSNGASDINYFAGKTGIGTTTPVNSLTLTDGIGFYGTLPTLSSCGTNPSILKGSTDNAGEITEGTIATGCTLTFAVAKTNLPFCTVTSQAGLVFSYTTSASAITITNVGALSGTKINYSCVQNNN